MNDLDAMRAHLGACGWLASTPETFRTALLSQTNMVRYGRGDCIYRDGDPTRGLYGLVHGAVAFEIAPYERGPNFAHVFRPGSWFGEMEILRPSDRGYTLVALRPSICLHVPLRSLEGMMAAAPDGWRYVGMLCAEHLATAIGAVDDLMIRSTEQRIAAVILRLADGRICDNPGEAFPEIDASHSDLAAMTNLGRAAITKCLAELEQAGLIERRYRRILVKDQPGLRRFVAPAASSG